MKKFTLILLAAIGMSLGMTSTSNAGVHFGVYVGPPGGYYYGPGPYYYGGPYWGYGGYHHYHHHRYWNHY